MQDIIIYMRYDGLLLKNQLCHPLYSASNALQRAYKRVLKKWGISYPQYLILLTLWEMDEQTVTQICEKTFFDSGTATPLLQKLSQKGLIQIKNLPTDKRSKVVSLSKKGLALKDHSTRRNDVFSQYESARIRALDQNDSRALSEFIKIRELVFFVNENCFLGF